MDSYNDYSVDGAKQFRQVVAMLRPHRIKGASKIRIGRHFDGGYTMLDDFDDVEAAYSLGINDDISWDMDMALRGIKLFQYDHTINELPSTHPLFNWKKIGIVGRAGQAKNLDTLEALIDKNSHGSNSNLILKCDIEGGEWDMLINTPNNILKQFSQIVLELHNMHHLSHRGAADAMRKAVVNLYASHRVVHVHGNNYAGMCVVGGYPLPCVLEVTLARLDRGEFVPSDESFPTSMDMPCNKDAADLYIGRFDFM